MKIAYYPGCTLKTSGQGFETSAIAASKILGIDFEEIPVWNCCGTVYSLASDDLIHQVAPIRNLIHVQDMGQERVVTLCSMCYNTLASANQLVNEDPSKLETLNAFMTLEEEYKGKVSVLHFLQLLKEEIGWEEIASKVTKNLNGMKIAAYYGCTLTRPRNVAIDDVEEPYILEALIDSLGGQPIDTPYKVECCGSYNTVNLPDVVVERTYKIIKSARANGAEAIVLSCPLCDFNLDERQKETMDAHPDFQGMPIFYFTQLMALALGVDEKECGFDKQHIDPYPLLKKYNLI